MVRVSFEVRVNLKILVFVRVSVRVKVLVRIRVKVRLGIIGLGLGRLASLNILRAFQGYKGWKYFIKY